MNISYLNGTLVLLIGTLGMTMPVTAQDIATLTLVGVSEDQCALGEVELGEGPLENFSSPSGAVFVVSNLTDPTTLSTRAAELNLALTAMCNGPHRLIIGSQNSGLWRNDTSSGGSGFGSAVPYRLGLSWADENRNLTLDAPSRQSVERELLIGRPNAGSVELAFIIDAGATNVGIGAPLLAGTYSDVVTVTVETQ